MCRIFLCERCLSGISSNLDVFKLTDQEKITQSRRTIPYFLSDHFTLRHLPDFFHIYFLLSSSPTFLPQPWLYHPCSPSFLIISLISRTSPTYPLLFPLTFPTFLLLISPNILSYHFAPLTFTSHNSCLLISSHLPSPHSPPFLYSFSPYFPSLLLLLPSFPLTRYFPLTCRCLSTSFNTLLLKELSECIALW